jgi:hypothetical protein
MPPGHDSKADTGHAELRNWLAVVLLLLPRLVLADLCRCFTCRCKHKCVSLWKYAEKGSLQD